VLSAKEQLPVGFDRVLLSWYQADFPKVPTAKEGRRQGDTVEIGHYVDRVHVGETWQFLVRLKRPRGFVNPGGQDYQLWLMRQGIDAIGYVRSGGENDLLHGATRISFNSLRETLRSQIRNVESELSNFGILTALVIGDKQQISTRDWQRLSVTGTNHLMVISGLHIGLVALACYWLGNVVARVLLIPLRWLPAQHYGALCSLFGAVFYSGLAGFSLPTQRACLMVLVAISAVLLQRQAPSFRLLMMALVGVLLLDPLAAHSLGFWLSFGAVATLMYSFTPWWGRFGWFQSWGRAQWVIFVGLLPVFAATVGQVPLLAPLANCLAIPVMSFLVVPLVLLGSLLLASSESLAVDMNVVNALGENLLVARTCKYSQTLPYIQYSDL